MTAHKPNSRLRLVFLALASCSALLAQTPDFKISKMQAVLKGSNKFLDVFFTQPLDSIGDLDPAGYTVQALPSDTSLTIDGIKRLTGGPNSIEITLSGDAKPTDVQIKLTINKRLDFMDGKEAKSANGPFTFTSTLIKDAATIQEAMKGLVDDMTKAGASSQEKNIFASGFVSTATGGQTQGGADIHLNSMDLGIPHLKSFLNIDKTTADGSDLKNFEAGGTYRSTYLLGKAGRARIQKALAEYESASGDAARKVAAEEYNKAVSDFSKATLAAVFLDLTGKMEGQATNFNVTNGVLEGSLRIQSRVKSFMGTKQGFFHFQILPGGIEGGKTLRQPDASTTTTATTTTDKALQQLDGLARLKTGATFNAYWKNPAPTGPVRQFEVEAGIVDRYLFLNEIHYDATTKTNNTILSGNKPYAHVDAKLFLVESDAGKYGLKLSYIRGSLPPVYAEVKSFQFGFLFESAK